MLVLAATLALLAGPARALDPSRPPHAFARTIFREELPQASVLALVQSAEGYLWLGTYEGLVRFDGVEFQVWDRQSFPAMRTNVTQCLAEDVSGGIWFGTSRGGVGRLKDGVVEVFGGESGLPSDNVTSVFRDRSGAVWIGTDRGVARWSDGRLEAFGEEQGFGPGAVLAFVESADGTVWAGGPGLREFREGRWSDSKVPPGVELPITALAADEDGTLWIGSISGVTRSDRDGSRTFRIGDGLAGGWVRCLLRDRSGTTWAGTEGRGLFRLRGEKIEAFSPVVEEKATDFVISLLEDREGNLWLGTRGGLIRMREGVFATLGAEQGLVGELARTVFQDSSGRIWVGADGGGLHLCDGGRCVPMNERFRVGSRRVRTIGEDEGGALWVGTSGAGVFRVRNGRTERIGLREGLADEDVRMIARTRDGTMWVGTRTGLASFRDGRALPASELSRRAGGANVLMEARDGSLWVGTAGSGLLVSRDGAVASFTAAGGLAGDAVFALHEDAEGDVWVGSADGLSRIRGGVVETFLAPEAFARDQVFSILEDGAGGLWTSNNKGVYRFPAASLKKAEAASPGPFGRLSFGVADGMPSRQCNGTTQPAALRARDGRLWYPTANGVAIVDPRLLRQSVPPPPVVLQRVVVDGAPVSIGERVVLAPGARRLEIGFAAPLLGGAARLSYRHRLVGFDDGWSVTHRRFASFTALPPGRYLFEVTAVEDAGLRSPSATRLEVRVLPRFAQTVAFRVFVVLAALLFAYALHRLRVRRMAVQERQLNRLVAEKTEALAEANARLEELSLSDSLTGIANRRQFDRRLEEEWRRCWRFDLPLAEVLLDVDFFKAYNDAFGHPAGDECLRRVAGALSDRLRRAGDLVARYGGEEFVALLPGLSLADAFSVAEQLRTRVEALRIPHPAGPDAVVTVSAGVASIVPGPGPSSLLTSSADAALYEAKRRGRNRSVAAGGNEPQGFAPDRPDAPPGRD
ncbi:MAG: ligand-binding sensor domain-containing diguanylate cyclase [Thermoanaerobaculia bacterium]